MVIAVIATTVCSSVIIDDRRHDCSSVVISGDHHDYCDYDEYDDYL